MPLPLIIAAGAAVIGYIVLRIIFDKEEEVEYRVEYYKDGQIKSETLTRRSKTSVKARVSVPIVLYHSFVENYPNGIERIVVTQSLERYFAEELGVSVSDIMSVERLEPST